MGRSESKLSKTERYAIKVITDFSINFQNRDQI